MLKLKIQRLCNSQDSQYSSTVHTERNIISYHLHLLIWVRTFKNLPWCNLNTIYIQGGVVGSKNHVSLGPYTGHVLFCIMMCQLICLFLRFLSLATPEPGEDPKVTRAKFFIRDEFLVSIHPGVQTFGLSSQIYSFICRPFICTNNLAV